MRAELARREGDSTAHRAEVGPRLHLEELEGLRWKEMAVRFALGAAASVVAGLITKLTDPRLGGIFLAFPSILPASLTFVQDREGTRKADRDAIGAVLGGVALTVFAVVGEAMFTRYNSAVVLVASLGAWILTSLVLYGVLAVLRPDDCDIRRD